MNSREKGARAERFTANKLKEYGYNCRRGQQFSAANGDADVVGLPRIHIENKHVERLNFYDAMAQATRDAKPDTLPAVFSKRNRSNIMVTMWLDDWIKLYKAWNERGIV